MKENFKEELGLLLEANRILSNNIEAAIARKFIAEDIETFTLKKSIYIVNKGMAFEITTINCDGSVIYLANKEKSLSFKDLDIYNKAFVYEKCYYEIHNFKKYLNKK